MSQEIINVDLQIQKLLHLRALRLFTTEWHEVSTFCMKVLWHIWKVEVGVQEDLDFQGSRLRLEN